VFLIGKVGSGKSTFFKSILEETKFNENDYDCKMKGKIAYIPQKMK
jgi:ABC-type Mn2+/Zn2+ transport system ATPase subunit